jgi:hypothetical protein
MKIKNAILSWNDVITKWPNQAEEEGADHKISDIKIQSTGVRKRYNISWEFININSLLFLEIVYLSGFESIGNT